MKNLLTILLLVAFSANVLLAQRTRPGVPVVYSPKVEVIESTDPADNFAEKGLPQPAIIGSNPTPKLAAYLAKEISKYDDNSLPMLMATLQKAGFFIINSDQKILYKPSYGNGIGLAFYDFEVVGMLNTSRAGSGTTIQKIAQIISSNDSDLPPDKIAESILKDLRNSSKSKNPEAAFVATLIFELGKNSPVPADITGATPQNSIVNIIQASIIERVFLGDLINSYEALSAETAFYRPGKLFVPSQDKLVNFVNIDYQKTLYVDPCSAIADLSNLQKGEKTIKKGVETALVFKDAINGADIGTSKAPKGILERLNLLKKVSQGVSKINAALSYYKLMVALSNVEGKIIAQDPMPLKRTKLTTEAAEERILTAQFTMKLKDTKQLNCVGKSLEISTGVKFGLPKEGRMADKPVSWELILNNGKTYDRNNPVYLDALDHKSTDKQMTDANGESKVKLTGLPQLEDMNIIPTVPVPKKVRVKVSIATQKMDFKEDGAKLGKAVLGAEINPLGFIELIPEMFGKLKLNRFYASIPVRDWQPCSEDWGGFINVKRTYSATTVIKSSRQSNGNSSGDGVRTIFEQDEIDVTLNPRTAEEILQKAEKKPADVVGKGIHSDITTIIREGDPCCGTSEGKWTTQVREGKIETYSDITKGRFDIIGSFSERDYSFSFSSYGFIFPSSERTFKEVDSDCELERNEAFDKTGESTLDFSPSLPSGRYGQRFVNSAAELLVGQKGITAGDGSKMVWDWELARCGK